MLFRSGQTSFVSGQKSFQKGGGRNGQKAFNDLKYINMDNLLKKRIMRRVYAIWFVKSVYAKMAVLGAILIASYLHISFVHVFSNTINASSGFLLSAKYLTSSFAAADIVSKFLLAGMIMAVFMMGRDLFKLKKENTLFARN